MNEDVSDATVWAGLCRRGDISAVRAAAGSVTRAEELHREDRDLSTSMACDLRLIALLLVVSCLWLCEARPSGFGVISLTEVSCLFTFLTGTKYFFYSSRCFVKKVATSLFVVVFSLALFT